MMRTTRLCFFGLVIAGILTSLLFIQRKNNAQEKVVPQALDPEDPWVMQFFGRVSLSSRSIELTYEFLKNTESHQGLFRIEPVESSEEFEVFEYQPEIGQEFLSSVNVEYFGEAGNLLCTYWGWGAFSQQLIVFGLSPDDEIELLYQGICRWGFRIVDVTGDGVLDICAAHGAPRGDRWTIDVFSWTPDGFELNKSVQSKPHQIYEIRSIP